MVGKSAQTLPGMLIVMATRTQASQHVPCRVKGLSRGLLVRTTALWDGARGWRDRYGHRLAWRVEETVVPVLHVLEHLEQKRFPVSGNFFSLEGSLLSCLGFGELPLEHVNHVHVDVKCV